MTPVFRHLDEGTNRHFAYFKHHLERVRPHGIGAKYHMPLPSDKIVRIYINGKCEIFFPYNDDNMRNAYLTFALTGYDIEETIKVLNTNWPNMPNLTGTETPEEDRNMVVN